MPAISSHLDALENMLSFLESEIYATPDRSLMESEDLQAVGAEARRIIGSVLVGRQVNAPRPRAHVADRRLSVKSRDLVQKLLVASPRAREIAGAKEVRSLSDEEFDALLERLAGSGLIPPQDA